jgi:integrase
MATISNQYDDAGSGDQKPEKGGFVKITKRLVDSVEPVDKEQFFWDKELKGFGLRVKPSGSKSYVIQYRNKSGRSRRYSIGLHGRLTPDEARDEAKKLLGDVERGLDPAEDKLVGRKDLTLKEFSERYLSEHAQVKKKARSIKEDRRLLEKVILPALASRKLNDITRADIARFHHGLKDTPYQANRALALISKMFSLAEKWGLRQDATNPCRHVEKFKEKKKERFLSGDELARLGEVLAEAQRNNEELPQAIAALRLLVLTGCRLSEILTLKWSDIDYNRSCLMLQDSKTGQKAVPIGDAVIEVLENMPRIVGSDYVIPGIKPGAHLVGLPKIWGRIRKKAGLEGVRIHDAARHSFASAAAASGFSLPFIGALLGHSQPATTARYSHLVGDPLKQAANKVSKKISDAMNAKPRQRGDIVELRKKTS